MTNVVEKLSAIGKKCVDFIYDDIIIILRIDFAPIII